MYLLFIWATIKRTSGFTIITIGVMFEKTKYLIFKIKSCDVNIQLKHTAIVENTGISLCEYFILNIFWNISTIKLSASDKYINVAKSQSRINIDSTLWMNRPRFISLVSSNIGK